MRYKIYINGNTFYIEDTEDSNRLYEGHAKDVLLRRENTVSTSIAFTNVNNWDRTKVIDFTTDVDLTGAPYTDFPTFVTWSEENLGKSSPEVAGQNGVNGWVLITDTQYTELSPLSLVGDTRTKITNNAGTVLNIVGLENGATIWDSVNNKIQPDNSGDTYDVRFQCTANPSINNRNLQLELDIGGTQGVIWDKTLRLARGANVNTRITETLDIFTLGTFIANGGEFYLTCDGDVDIYDISFKIERKFKYVP